MKVLVSSSTEQYFGDINLNESIFSSIDNIYQLSKIIIPINNKNQTEDPEKRYVLPGVSVRKGDSTLSKTFI